MKSIVLMSALMITLLGCSSRQASHEEILIFAQDLKYLIGNSDVDAFIQIPCFPISCDDGVVDIIFGGAEITPYERVLSDPATDVKVFGPYTNERASPNQSWEILYYNPAEIHFDSDARIDSEVGMKEFGIKLFQTTVIPTDDGIAFHRTPFYLFAHHPYAGEYGSLPPNNRMSPAILPITVRASARPAPARIAGYPQR